MTIAALVIAVLALLLAFAASKRAGAFRERVDTLSSTVARAQGAAEEASERARKLEEFLKRMADGQAIDGAMIEEGRLFAEIDAEKARALLERGGGEPIVVVDVRTQEEVEGGHIAGARWIPIDEIERRYRELPKDRTLLVFCAAGGRSAVACDFLSTRGYAKLANVVGGMSAWRGPTKRGLPSALPAAGGQAVRVP